MTLLALEISGGVLLVRAAHQIPVLRLIEAAEQPVTLQLRDNVADAARADRNPLGGAEHFGVGVGLLSEKTLHPGGSSPLAGLGLILLRSAVEQWLVTGPLFITSLGEENSDHVHGQIALVAVVAARMQFVVTQAQQTFNVCTPLLSRLLDQVDLVAVLAGPQFEPGCRVCGL